MGFRPGGNRERRGSTRETLTELIFVEGADDSRRSRLRVTAPQSRGAACALRLTNVVRAGSGSGAERRRRAWREWPQLRRIGGGDGRSSVESRSSGRGEVEAQNDGDRIDALDLRRRRAAMNHAAGAEMLVERRGIGRCGARRRGDADDAIPGHGASGEADRNDLQQNGRSRQQADGSIHPEDRTRVCLHGPPTPSC